MSDEKATSALALSVVLITDRFATVRRVLTHLAAQTRARAIELVIAHPIDAPFELDDEPIRTTVASLGAVRTVPVTAVVPMAIARAAAVRATTAPLVFLGETHSFAHPNFAAELLDAFDGSCDVLVPGIGNANPGSVLSWAAFLADYGAWLHVQSPAMIGPGPTWNSAYSRETLNSVSDVLDEALGHGTIFSERIRAAHRRVRFVPSARLDHANVATTRDWVYERYLSGLLVATHRRRDWSMARRLIYVALSPLIPVVTLWRIRPAVAAALQHRLLPRGALMALAAGAIVRTVGEVVGYLVTPAAQRGVDMEQDYELHKLQYVGEALA